MTQAQTLDIKLFNQSTHHYHLLVKGGNVTITSNEESQDFNAYIPFHGEDIRQFEGAAVTGIACLGNQHANAVVRDMMRVAKWDKQTLKEYSMFTIGDFLITTADSIYFAVNGDLEVRKMEEGLGQVRGKA
ncbi:hypothetical protein [Pseudomonas phage D6]|nr:hypothetical protein [Pseudomonas phage D6]